MAVGKMQKVKCGMKNVERCCVNTFGKLLIKIDKVTCTKGFFPHLHYAVYRHSAMCGLQ